MRKITLFQTLVFILLFLIYVSLSYLITSEMMSIIRENRFSELYFIIAFIFLFYVFSIIGFRLFLKVKPLKVGSIEVYSSDEFVYHIYILHYLIFFHPIMRSQILPMPAMTLFYILLGAKINENSFTGGIIHDAHFVEIGKNSLMGQYSLIVPHIIENEKLAHFKIKIGNNVTVGAHSIIMADVQIGDNALVAMNSVVTKGTIIGDGEVWGGSPAKKIK